jgi:hypothetical protein
MKTLLTLITLVSMYSIQSAIADTAPTAGDQHISVTGAIFTRDTSNPALGEAYRDPSGLIWGNPFKDGDRTTLSYAAAEEYCKNAGGRLPTAVEFQRLRSEYLGYDAYATETHYNPFLADGKTDVLPGLSRSFFWGKAGVFFDGTNGEEAFISLGHGDEFHVRCVSGPQSAVK